MDWGAIIAGGITGTASVVTLLVANRSNQRQADRRLAAEAREHRFDARLDAVVAFDEAATAEHDRMWQIVEETNGPSFNILGSIDAYYHPATLLAAQARVRILATPEVIDRAADVFDGLRMYFFRGDEDAFLDAMAAYHEACHSMLDAEPTVRRAESTPPLDPPEAERAQSITPGTPWPSVAEAAPPAENTQHVSEEGGGESPVRA